MGREIIQGVVFIMLVSRRNLLLNIHIDMDFLLVCSDATKGTTARWVRKDVFPNEIHRGENEDSSLWLT